MRLIDADKFADTLKNISDANWFKKEQKEAFETIIGLLIGIDKEKYSPTAYDINEVVEELREWSLDATMLELHNNELGEYEEERKRDVICTLNAIEIVRQGVR